MVKRVLDKNQQPTIAQIKMIEEAAKKEVVYDEDAPKLTPKLKAAFINAAKERDKRKEVV